MLLVIAAFNFIESTQILFFLLFSFSMQSETYIMIQVKKRLLLGPYDPVTSSQTRSEKLINVVAFGK